MSVITDMVLITSEDADSPAMRAFHAWCRSEDGGDGQMFERLPLSHGDLRDDRGWTLVPGGEHPQPVPVSTGDGRVPYFTGGHKVFTKDIYVCAGNFFRWEELVEAFPSFGWGKGEWSPDAELTVLLIQYEHSEEWRAFLGNGKRVPASRTFGGLDP
jgi:hypothetical protein